MKEFSIVKGSRWNTWFEEVFGNFDWKSFWENVQKYLKTLFCIFATRKNVQFSNLALVLSLWKNSALRCKNKKVIGCAKAWPIFGRAVPCRAGPCRVALSSKVLQLFNQLFFQSYWSLSWCQLVLRSWLVLRMCPPLASLTSLATAGR